MSTLAARLGYLLACIMLAYFVMYAIACPTRELVCAVAFEVATFLVVLFLRLRKTARRKDAVREAVLDELSRQHHLARKSFRLFKLGTVGCLILVVALLSIDLTALLLVNAKQFALARPLYLANPIYRIPGVHPAFSAELLAGALIESNHLQEAEGLSNFLFDIRKSMFGEKHELIAEMYGNFAIINLKKGNYQNAEALCRRSIAMKEETCGHKRLGNALTKLGETLTKQKRFDEAKTCYEDALAMREREFGRQSDKVLETLRQMETSFRASSDPDGANSIAKRIASIEAAQKVDPERNFLFPICLGISLLGSYLLFRPRGFLTERAMLSIKDRVDKSGSQADRKDVERLISMYTLRKDFDMVSHYQSFLQP